MTTSQGSQAVEGQKSDPLFALAERLNEAERLRQDRRPQRSKRICVELLRQFPEYVGALHTLGLVFADIGDFENAASMMGKAAMLCPGNWRILADLGAANMMLGRLDSALESFKLASRISDNEENIIVNLATIYKKKGNFDQAVELFEEYIKNNPEANTQKFFLAECFEELGRFEDARVTFQSIFDRDRSSIEAFLRLAGLPGSDLSHYTPDLLGRADFFATADEEKRHYARAYGLHRARRYENAWEQLVAANEFMRQPAVKAWRHGATSREKSLEIVRNIPVLDNKLAELSGQTISLFILGPSRSGKTTLELLLRSIPGLKRGMESNIVEDSVSRTMQVSGYIPLRDINRLPSIIDSKFIECYQKYMNDIHSEVIIFTNTKPELINAVARCIMTIPASRFIFVKRNVDDLIMRIYMYKYISGNNYAYDVRTIGEYVKWYYALIDIYADKFPDLCRVIEYEEMIENPRSAVIAASELCGTEVGNLDTVGSLGDDCGVAEPYLDKIRQALGS